MHGSTWTNNTCQIKDHRCTGLCKFNGYKLDITYPIPDYYPEYEPGIVVFDNAILLTGGLTIKSTTNSSSVTNGGSLLVGGGVSIGKDTYLGGNIETTGVVLFKGYYIPLNTLCDHQQIHTFVL